MKLKRLLVTMRIFKRLLPEFISKFKRQMNEPEYIEMEYVLRTEDLTTREVRYKKYSSMDEIVKYVYFDVPLTVPNYANKNFTLVHKNLHSGKEHIIQLKIGKRTECEYDNWHQRETI